MKIKWSTEAKQNYFDTLDYWEEHNGSFEYSSKIIKKIKVAKWDITKKSIDYITMIPKI